MKRNPFERKLFVGTEVENTKAKGMKTLFLAGPYSTQEAVVSAMTYGVDQIYLAANQSYCCRDDHDWVQAIVGLLGSWKGKYVTIDVPLSLRAAFLHCASRQSHRIDESRLLIQYSATLRDLVRELGTPYLKIDDDVRQVSNPGVWVWPLSDLTDVTKPNFTSWDAYKGDQDV